MFDMVGERDMKILHIITDANIGGAGRLLLAYLSECNRAAFDIEVALPEGSLLIPELVALNVSYIEVPHISARSFSVAGVRALYRVLCERKPDIVHTHASLAGRVAARLRGCKIIFSRHYCIYPPDLKATRFPRKQIAGLVNRILSHAIIATSHEVEKGLIETGTAPEMITTICNAVPPVRIYSLEKKAAIRERYGIAQETFVVAQLARLDEIKGQDFSLDAAKILVKDLGVLVLLAGEGPSEEHLRTRIKNESIGNVLMTGFVREIDEIIAIADVQLNASFTETTCLALLEGMSIGLPAVATAVGGTPYVIDHEENGLLVPVRDGAALAEAVLRLKNDADLYRKISAGARAKYESHFRAGKMARDIENLYRSVAAE